MVRWFESVYVCALLSVALASCIPPLRIGPEGPPPAIYYPHIESIDLPSEVHVHGQVAVAVKLSMNASPGRLLDNQLQWGLVLTSPVFDSGVSNGKYHPGKFLGLYASSIGYAAPIDGVTYSPPGTMVRFSMEFDQLGANHLYFADIAEPAQGGFSDPPQPLPVFEDTPPFEYREVVVNVLP